MSKTSNAWVVATLLLLPGCLLRAAADEAPAAANPAKLKAGLSSVSQLLALMDTDRNGKVSKDEFMQFMQAEFEFADKNNDGELDPKEFRTFVSGLNRPVKGPGR